jgi:hypothetical protein
MPLESYENMKTTLEKTEDEKYNRKICGNLKVIAIFLGLQRCYTKFYAFCVSRTVQTENLTSKNSDLN